jgi:hypothetical protein
VRRCQIFKNVGPGSGKGSFGRGNIAPFGKEVHISFATQRTYQAGIAVRKNEVLGKRSGLILDEHCRDIAGRNQNAAAADFAADFQEEAQRRAGRRAV